MKNTLERWQLQSRHYDAFIQKSHIQATIFGTMNLKMLTDILSDTIQGILPIALVEHKNIVDFLRTVFFIIFIFDFGHSL